MGHDVCSDSSALISVRLHDSSNTAKTQAVGRWLGAALLCVLALLLAAAPRQAAAQTAHYAEATSPVGSGFNTPFGVAVDAHGNVFVADFNNNAVKEIVAGTNGAAAGTVNANSTMIVVGSGFSNPEGVAVDRYGNVFVADRGHNLVKEIIADTGSTAGAGKVDSNSTVIQVGGTFDDSHGVAVDTSGDVFVTSFTSGCLYEIVAGTGTATSGTVNASSTVNTVNSSSFSLPSGVAVDTSGDVFVADYYHNAVKEVVAGTGTAGAGTVNSSSTVSTVGSGFSLPSGVAVDASGNVFVADLNNNAVKEIVAGTGGAASGTVNSSSTVKTFGNGYSQASAVAVAANGNIFASDSAGSNAVMEIQPGAANLGSVNVGVATPPTATLTFYFDSGGTIAVPAVLTQGASGLDFTDAETGTCTTNGTSQTYAAGDTCTVVVKFKPTRPGQRLGATQLMGSGGAVIATEYIYGIGTGPQVALTPGTIGTVAGKGTPGYSGDGGAATSAKLGNPTGVAVDSAGNIYIADYLNNRIRKVDTSGNISTVAGNGTYGYSGDEGAATSAEFI